MSKKTNIEAGKWDFYLTDEEEASFLHCKLKSYHLDRDDRDDNLIYAGPFVRFMYEVSPEAISERPEALVLTMGEFESFFYSKEYETYLESCVYEVSMLTQDSARKIEISCFEDIDGIVAAMGNEPGQLELVYYSTISISNPMAHLIYMIQLRDHTVDNLFFENPGDRYTLYRAEYVESLKRIEFYIEDTDCFVPYDNGVIEDLFYWEDHGSWYEFYYYDLVRAASRWISTDMLFGLYGGIQIVNVSDGKEVVYPIANEDIYKQYFGDRCDESADIERVYIEEIDKEQIKDLILYQYGDTHNFLELKIPDEDFIKDYKNIPAIADNDSIEEV